MTINKISKSRTKPGPGRGRLSQFFQPKPAGPKLVCAALAAVAVAAGPVAGPAAGPTAGPAAGSVAI